MAEQAQAAPITPEERQAVTTVGATRAVFSEIEKLAAIIKESWRPAPQRADAKHALGYACERLCNLMALAVHQLDAHTQGPLHDRLKADLDVVRGRLMSMSAHLMVEKLEKIDQRAEQVLKDADYPIGLAGKLDSAFADLMANLTMLGGAERLGDKVPDLIAKTETSLKSLSAIEKKVGVFTEVQPRKQRR